MLFFWRFQIFLWPLFFACCIYRFTSLFQINNCLLRAFFNFKSPILMIISLQLSFHRWLYIYWLLIACFFVSTAHSSVLSQFLIFIIIYFFFFYISFLLLFKFIVNLFQKTKTCEIILIYNWVLFIIYFFNFIHQFYLFLLNLNILFAILRWVFC